MDVDIVVSTKERMNKTVEALKRELGSLKAGRANASLLERITVDYYGTQTPITQMANISTPEPRLLAIALYDPSTLKSVEKAILASDLGINPSNDGKIIRLLFPELTGERRKELSKQVKKFGEESKVAIRSIRRDANDAMAKEEKNKLMTEDDRRKYEKDVQKLTDDTIKLIDSIVADKEKEIMSV
ncbi:MAG: ribosome recycling factor [Clostridiales bacterium]|nr:ribosome recycling factor [Clostridiales bacterium]